MIHMIICEWISDCWSGDRKSNFREKQFFQFQRMIDQKMFNWGTGGDTVQLRPLLFCPFRRYLR